MSTAAVDLVAALVAVDMEGPTAVGLAAVILVAASAAADMAGTPATSGTAVRMAAAAAVASGGSTGGARGALAPLPPGTPWSPPGATPRIFCAINGGRGCSGLQELEEEEASAPLYFILGSAPGGGGGDGGSGDWFGGGFRRDQRDRRDLRGGGHNYGAGGFYHRGGDDGWRRPRPPKLSFPRYDGESDPLTWLNKCDLFFRGASTMEEEKVWTTSLHLDGVAAEWYFQLERDHGLVSWARFGEYLNLRFGPPICSNSLGELKELKRTASVEEYQRRFLALLCRCDDLTPQHQIDLFTAGLGQPLSSDVEMQRPTSLQSAMSLARAYERRTSSSFQAPKSAFRSKQLAAPSASAASTPTSELPKTETAKPRFRRLSPEEIAENRANGQCYFCPEKFSKDHKCATKGVFLLAMDNDDDSEPRGRYWDILGGYNGYQYGGYSPSLC